MSKYTKLCVWSSLLHHVLLGITVEAQGTTSYIYLDNTQYIANGSNVVAEDWSTLQAAFKSPSHSDIASFAGFDWTKPYPGAALNGFQAHLRIANDVAFPAVTTTENVTTNVGAITYGIPSSLMGSNGLPKSMDPSWYICQHYFVSTVPDPTQSITHDCSFLPAQCITDFKSSLVQNWGTQQDDSGTMCGMSAFDAITPSCQAALGAVRADVLGWDSSFFSDATSAKALTVDEVSSQSWMIGTGYNDPGNQTAYYASTNRTYVLATVFGYSSSVSGGAAPAVELACLRPSWSAAPNTATTSPSITSSTSTAKSTTATSSSSTVQSSKTSSTTAAATPTMHCTGGTRASGISDNFLGLCSFSCDYDHCPENVCVCTKSASAAVAAPTASGQNGCPDTNQLSTQSDYAYYQDLCEFTCSHSYCPAGACRAC